MYEDLIRFWNKAQAIGFDIDLTLMDTLDAQLTTFNQVLQIYGVTQSLFRDDVRKGLLSGRMTETFEKLKKEFGLKDMNVLEAKTQYFQLVLHNKDEDKPYENAEAMIREIKKQKKLLFLVTKAGKDEAMLNVEKLEALVGKRFYDCLITQDDVKDQKPDPEPLIETMIRLNDLGEYVFRYVFVGDRAEDVQMVANYNAIHAIPKGNPVLLETNIPFARQTRNIQKLVGENHFKEINELYQIIRK